MRFQIQQGQKAIGLEAAFDPGWLAGLQYVRNLVYTMTSLPREEQPQLRLLPLDVRSLQMIRDLERFEAIEIAAPLDRNLRSLSAALLLRRLIRKVVQPRLRRVLSDAFQDLEVTFPGWGTPIPGVAQMHWVPDLQHVFLPHLFEREEIERRDRQLQQLAEGRDTLVFSSHSALADFRQIYPDARPVVHVWQFCSPVTEEEHRGANPHDRYGLPRRYVYVPNQFWAHKDHLTLFRALSLLRKSGDRPTLVCTGLLADRRNPGYIEQLQGFLSSEGLGDQVKILGVVPRSDQIEILKSSTLVVQPSRFEGWSTVVEDAKAVGRPMVLSDFRVHLEQAPDHVFFEMGSPESLAEALRTYLPGLPDGPDPAAEARAKEVLDERRYALARQFLEFAGDAAAREKGS